MRKVALVGVLGVLLWFNVGASAQVKAKLGEWWTYGGDLASTRYSALDQINKDNFKNLEVAWRFKTDFLGPRPEFNFQSTPLEVDGLVYSPLARAAPSSRSTRRRANSCGCTARTRGNAVKPHRVSSPAAASP